jgi:hypothetical protein
MLTQHSKEHFHPLSYELSNYSRGRDHWKGAKNWSMNLAELRLIIDFDFTKLIHNVATSSPFIDAGLFPNLNKLAFCYVVTSDEDVAEKSEVARMMTEKLLARINLKLGVTAVLESVLEGTEQQSLLEDETVFVSVKDVWFWQAPPKTSFARLAWEQSRFENLES